MDDPYEDYDNFRRITTDDARIKLKKPLPALELEKRGPQTADPFA